jgi:hypothetical protein
MKCSVAVALILGGVLVVALPPLSDAWRTFVFARLLEHGANSIEIDGRMEDTYRIGCWLLGAAMISVAVIGSLAPASETDERELIVRAG